MPQRRPSPVWDGHGGEPSHPASSPFRETILRCAPHRFSKGPQWNSAPTALSGNLLIKAHFITFPFLPFSFSHFRKTKQNKAKNKNKNKNPIPQNVCTQIFASGSALQKTQTETEQMAIAGGMGKVDRSAMYLGGRVNMICPCKGHREGRGRRVCHS